MDKKELRSAVRAAVKQMSEVDKTQQSTMIALALVVHPAVRDAKMLALFSPLPDEPQIGEIIDILARERTVVLPRIEGDVMSFYKYSPSSLHKGAYGIMEPAGDVPVNPADVDAMVVPGVVFTSDGKRMGRGKGYYDRYMSLPGFRAYKIGVCYSQQLVDFIPCEPHDIVMDEVIYR